jgi:sodium/potassium-transporting ATPase subunit beta
LLRNITKNKIGPQKKQFLGRTGCSWAKITLFYLIFYSCLAGFFAIMMAGFFATLSDTRPTMTGMYSLIKQNPGMGYRPRRDYDSTLIMFKAVSNSTEGKYADLIKTMMKFLEDDGYVKDNTSIPSEGNTTFSVKEITDPGGACPLNDFGFRNGTPCVILKLNKVFDWQPDLANSSDWYGNAEKALKRVPDLDYVGVSCEGENDGDVDNMGEVEFHPPNGFLRTYYPYENQKPYRAPLVFAKFKNPERGVIMQIWCKAWARNIKHHKNDKGGSTHFELFVDGKDDSNKQSGGNN